MIITISSFCALFIMSLIVFRLGYIHGIRNFEREMACITDSIHSNQKLNEIMNSYIGRHITLRSFLVQSSIVIADKLGKV